MNRIQYSSHLLILFGKLIFVWEILAIYIAFSRACNRIKENANNGNVYKDEFKGRLNVAVYDILLVQLSSS